MKMLMIIISMMKMVKISLISMINKQATIEDSLGGELSFAVQPGDVVLGY